ncbi:metal ABC transporter permease [Salinivibrio socompensis]|uniref:metal ABC transporter permease n=1 Tax=Salinivibrio socompensis TaxID=1510206 RepID=UPI0004B1AE8D|nr:metal ABC transporter permease [Salinivibrio socompensis]
MNPYQLTFMQDALLMAVLVALPCALLSCYLVLKGWSLIGDAVAHAVLPGLVLANLFGLPLIVGAFAAGSACAPVCIGSSKIAESKKTPCWGLCFLAFSHWG